MLAGSAFLLVVCMKRHPVGISPRLVRLTLIWEAILLALLTVANILPAVAALSIGTVVAAISAAWSYFRLRKLAGPATENL
jgi:hypothetical protein